MIGLNYIGLFFVNGNKILAGKLCDFENEYVYNKIMSSELNIGSYYHGVVRAPVPRMAATAAIVSLGTADLFAPLPVIFGQAHGIPAWTTSLLQYDPTRLA